MHGRSSAQEREGRGAPDVSLAFCSVRVKVGDIAGLRHGSHCTGNSGRSPEGIEKEGDQMVRNQ